MKSDFTLKNGVYLSPDGRFKLRERKGRNMEMMPEGIRRVWISTGTKDCDTAEEFARNYLASGGAYTSRKITFGEYAKDFFTRTDSKSYRKYMENFGKFYSDEYYAGNQSVLKPAVAKFGKYELGAISSAMIEQWYVNAKKNNGEEYASGTKLRILNIMSIVFKHAKKAKLIKENPVAEVERVASKSKPRKIFTPEEIVKLFPFDDEKLLAIWSTWKYALFFSIMVDTGWRENEINALAWSGIYENGVYTDNATDPLGRLKQGIKTTGKGVPVKQGILSDYTLRLLEKVREENPDEEYVFITKATGRGIRAQLIIKTFAKALKNAGIEADGRTPYCLRHTFDTYMLDKAGQVDGLDEKTVRELMAHTGYRPEYDHRTPEQMIRRMSRITPIINAMRKEGT